MILGIHSDLDTFKPLTFHGGLNILVADRTEASTEGQTRNSAGKTSAIEAIHFLTGADAGKGSLFQSPALSNYAFYGRFLLGDHEVTVSRKGNTANQIQIGDESARAIGAELTRDRKTNLCHLPVKRWRELLGHFWFGLPHDPKGTEFDEPFSPSFRSMVSYFARRIRGGGFATPERQSEKQQPSDWQINLSYLIGLDWRIPREIETLRVNEASLRDLKKAIKDGAFGKMFGSVAEIRPELERVKVRAERVRRQVGAFEVVEEFRERAQEAADARTRMKAIGHEIVQARMTVEHLSRVSEDERPPEYAALDRIYKAAGVELPGVVLKRFDAVKAFQLSVVSNRRAHLAEQVAEAEARIADLDAEMKVLDASQARIMSSLKDKGALEDFTRMSDELAVLEMQAEMYGEKLGNASELEGKKNEFQIRRLRIHERLQADHRERVDVLTTAMRRIDATISDLYDDRRGNLIVEATPKGPDFRINIQGDGNRGGIDHMEIFCFDLMLYQAAQERFGGPGFLVHDSHLYDGVDPRQVRSALMLAKRVVGDLGGQYIVTMNSETLPLVGINEQDNDDILLPRLSDGEDGGLFGIRFDQG
ncbi:DUF2326 domain-containing protein [Methylobacterium sp. WL64]|uniref:ABC-three component system protein n=1 Tax=Methylobacterium sp. WL64 TaxID=2603894 RepID=UPI0011CBB34F|nr:ABC-three component system protein [Methylobacterium sp. WL64]TXN04875.1 DUF2326 domain-containing protein [Methylobacterium sp. WL64]